MKPTSQTFVPEDPVTEAREALFETAREFGTGDSRHGDVIAAAIRYTSQLLKGWGYNELVRDLEKVAQGAEERKS